MVGVVNYKRHRLLRGMPPKGLFHPQGLQVVVRDLREVRPIGHEVGGGELGGEGDQVSRLSRAHNLQRRRKHLPALDNVLGGPGSSDHLLQDTAAPAESEDPDSSAVQVSRGLRKHCRPARAGRSRHDDEPSDRSLRVRLRPGFHHLGHRVIVEAYGVIGPHSHGSTSSRPQVISIALTQTASL